MNASYDVGGRVDLPEPAGHLGVLRPRVRRHRVAVGVPVDPEDDVGEEDEFFKFCVGDDGPGIAPEFHEKIWETFQTLEPRDKVEGTGIGLALVRKHVVNRGGRAWVESREGQGATFFFLWPKRPVSERD